MAEIGRWNNHKFEVSPSVIRSFTDLQIKGASETEEKEIGGEKYISRKSAKPTEVSFTIHLHALVGCDVQSEALAFVEEANAGKKDYFYLGNKKVFTYQLMLTEATICQTEIGPGGKWISADVQITMKRCNQSTGGGGGFSKQTIGQTKPTTEKTIASALTAATEAAVSAAVASIKKITTAAKKASSNKGGGGGGGAKRVATTR